MEIDDPESTGLTNCARIAVIDDHPIFRAGLRRLLATEPGFEVVVETSSAKEAPRLIQEAGANIVLMDFSMPEMNGLEGLRLLQEASVAAKTILLTAQISPDEKIEALRLGAVGVLFKSSAAELLFECIREVMKDRYWVDRETVDDLITAIRTQDKLSTETDIKQDALNQADLRLIRALARGWSNKRIARDFGVAEQTIKNQLSRLYGRLGVEGRLELVLKATRDGLLGTHMNE